MSNEIDLPDMLDNKLNLNQFDDDFENLSGYGYGSKTSNRNKNKPQKITIKLIMDRNITKTIQDKISAECTSKLESVNLKAKYLLKLTRIHLDRERIDELDNLAEYLGDITNLYLNVNLISRIENLEFFKNLKILVLAENLIERVENLKQLKNLKLLDLSSNRIERFDVAEFPGSLAFLDLRENPCTKNDAWRKEECELTLITFLRGLCQLNGEALVDLGHNEENEEQQNDDNKDDVVKEGEISNHDMNLLHKNILERSKLRQKSDLINFEKEWVRRKAKLESIQKSISEKFSDK